MEKKSFLALLALLMVGLMLCVAYWTFVAVGYQITGSTMVVPNISVVSVTVVGRVSEIIFLLLFAFFTLMIISAVVDSFFPEKRRVVILATVCLALVAIGTSAYTIAVIVMRYLRTEVSTEVMDVSGPVLTGVSFVFSVVLTLSWLLAWRVVESKRDSEIARVSEMRRNALWFFCGSAGLAAVFLACFVISLLELTLDYFRYHNATVALEASSRILTVVAVLVYVGMAVIGSARGRSETQSEPPQYVPLYDSEIPTIYEI